MSTVDQGRRLRVCPVALEVRAPSSRRSSPMHSADSRCSEVRSSFADVRALALRADEHGLERFGAVAVARVAALLAAEVEVGAAGETLEETETRWLREAGVHRVVAAGAEARLAVAEPVAGLGAVVGAADAAAREERAALGVVDAAAPHLGASERHAGAAGAGSRADRDAAATTLTAAAGALGPRRARERRGEQLTPRCRRPRQCGRGAPSPHAAKRYRQVRSADASRCATPPEGAWAAQRARR
jgi:hypothetical protein